MLRIGELVKMVLDLFCYGGLSCEDCSCSIAELGSCLGGMKDCFPSDKVPCVPSECANELCSTDTEPSDGLQCFKAGLDSYSHFIIATARICHELNKVFCVHNGDFSQVSWSEAPESIRLSAISGIVEIFGGRILSPQQSHEAWREHKISSGWTWGDVKDEEKKTHPCLVPYEELPSMQKEKDTLFFYTAKLMAGLYNSVKNK